MARSYSAMNPMGKDFMTDQERFNAQAQQQADAANAQRAQNVSNMEFAAGDRAAFQRAAQEFSAGESALGRAQQTSMQQGGPGMMSARLNERSYTDQRDDSALRRGMEQGVLAQAAGQMDAAPLSPQQIGDMQLGIISPGMGIAAMQGRQQNVQWERALIEQQAQSLERMAMNSSPEEAFALQQRAAAIRSGQDSGPQSMEAPASLGSRQRTWDIEQSRDARLQSNQARQMLDSDPQFQRLVEEWRDLLSTSAPNADETQRVSNAMQQIAIDMGMDPEAIREELVADLEGAMGYDISRPLSAVGQYGKSLVSRTSLEDRIQSMISHY